jgi:hypothetical protein
MPSIKDIKDIKTLQHVLGVESRINAVVVKKAVLYRIDHFKDMQMKWTSVQVNILICIKSANSLLNTHLVQ